MMISFAQAEALNLLLIGVDRAQEGERGRSDTMMLARIDPDRAEIRLLSFLRDLYVDIPGWRSARLNAAYQHGGEALLKETLHQRFGVQIDRTATVEFSQLAEMVDDIGGIDIEVEARELAPLNDLLDDFGAPPVKEAGLVRMNGTQALCYSRIRRIDSDFQRASRQQKVIAAMLAQMAGKNKWELLRLAIANLGKIRTDVSLGDVAAMAPLAGRLDELEIRTAQVPQTGAFSEKTVNGMQVLLPQLAKCRADVEAFLSEE